MPRKIYHSVSPENWKGILIGCLIASALCGCSQKTEPTAEQPTARISENQIVFATNAPQLAYLKVEPAAERKAVATGLYGRIAWNNDVTVRIFSPVAGRVLDLPFEMGQKVEAGAVLARLDSPDFAQARADARTAAGNYLAAEKNLKRAQDLLAHAAGAQKDVEAAEAAYTAAAAEKDRSFSRLQNYGGNEQSTNALYELKSPMAGILVEKNIGVGQEIRSDLMLANSTPFTNPQFVVTDPEKPWLFLDVDETSISSITTGSEVLITTKAYPGKVFNGRLENIGHELDPTTRTIKARCIVDNKERLLRAEMYVTAEVASSGKAEIELPTKAIFLKNESSWVFVENQTGQYERRKVQTGLETEGWTVIAQGIEPGQKVVVDGCLLLESLIEGVNP